MTLTSTSKSYHLTSSPNAEDSLYHKSLITIKDLNDPLDILCILGATSVLLLQSQATITLRDWPVCYILVNDHPQQWKSIFQGPLKEALTHSTVGRYPWKSVLGSAPSSPGQEVWRVHQGSQFTSVCTISPFWDGGLYSFSETMDLTLK